MTKTKRTAAFLLAALISLSAAGCGNPGTSSSARSAPSSQAAAPSSGGAETKTTVKVAALKGPTGLSMVKLMKDGEKGETAGKYEFSLVNTPDEIVAKLSSGEIDVGAAPTNLAATLYNKAGGRVQLAAVTTLGVLYVLTNGEQVESVKDLKGKTVASSGQGATPEYAFDYILKQNGLEAGKDVKVEFTADHAELAASMIAGKTKLAVLPEPFVTQVTAKNGNVKVALNLTDEWDKASGGKSVLTMGCLIVRRDFAEKNKEAFDAFLDEYKASAEYAVSNGKETAELSGKYGVMDASVAQKAIPNCGIVYLDGDDMRSKIPDFLQILYSGNPKSVGGKLPGDDFYYKK